MLNYIHGELWRTFRKISSVFFFGLLVLLPLAANVLFAFLNFSWHYYEPEARIGLVDSLTFFTAQIPLWGCLLVFITSGIVFGDELRLHTIKNSVASGMGRGVVYFGKFMAELVYSILGLGVAASSLLISGLIFLPWDFSTLPEILNGYLRLLIGCIPLWAGILGFLNFIMFSIHNGVAIAGISMLTAFFLLLFLSSFPFTEAVNFFLPLWLMKLGSHGMDTDFLNPTFLLKCWGLGIVYMGIFSFVGYLTFCRRELK